MTHLGRDGAGQCMTAEGFNGLDGGRNPSPLVESFAQCLCRLLCEEDQEKVLTDAFDRLEKKQSPAYRQWRELYDWRPQMGWAWQKREELLRLMLQAARALGRRANLANVKLSADLLALIVGFQVVPSGMDVEEAYQHLKNLERIILLASVGPPPPGTAP